jgi:S1-C subfamily serine protease
MPYSRRSRRGAPFAALALILTACSASAVDTPYGNGAEPQRETREAEATREARAVTYRVRAWGCDALVTGSGFAVDERTVVTNRHVVEGAWRLALNSWDGRDVAVQSIAVSKDHDLAVLRTSETMPAWAKLGDAESGDAVWVVGYPLGGKLTVTRGSIVTEVEGDELSAEGPVEVGKVWQVSAKVRSGDSGGPLISRDGRVVGVVYGYGETSGNGYAVKSRAVQGALKGEHSLPAAECEP